MNAKSFHSKYEIKYHLVQNYILHTFFIPDGRFKIYVIYVIELVVLHIS